MNRCCVVLLLSHLFHFDPSSSHCCRNDNDFRGKFDQRLPTAGEISRSGSVTKDGRRTNWKNVGFAMLKKTVYYPSSLSRALHCVECMYVCISGGGGKCFLCCPWRRLATMAEFSPPTSSLWSLTRKNSDLFWRGHQVAATLPNEYLGSLSEWVSD